MGWCGEVIVTTVVVGTKIQKQHFEEQEEIFNLLTRERYSNDNDNDEHTNNKIRVKYIKYGKFYGKTTITPCGQYDDWDEVWLYLPLDLSNATMTSGCDDVHMLNSDEIEASEFATSVRKLKRYFSNKLSSSEYNKSIFVFCVPYSYYDEE